MTAKHLKQYIKDLRLQLLKGTPKPTLHTMVPQPKMQPWPPWVLLTDMFGSFTASTRACCTTSPAIPPHQTKLSKISSSKQLHAHKNPCPCYCLAASATATPTSTPAHASSMPESSNYR